MESKGVNVLFSETTFSASNENTKAKANAIPIAKLIPIPPRFFSEANDRANIERMIMETITQRIYMEL